MSDPRAWVSAANMALLTDLYALTMPDGDVRRDLAMGSRGDAAPDGAPRGGAA